MVMTSSRNLPPRGRAIATSRVADFKSERPRSNRNRWPPSFRNQWPASSGISIYETWAVTFLMRGVPSIDDGLRAVEYYGRLGTALSTIPAHDKFNLAGAAVAALVAGFSYAAQLHDRVSDLFKIRHRFDLGSILFPLALLVGTKFSAMQLNAVDANRNTLMHKVFYKYASSRADKPLVDKHDIEHALAAWSWFWILVESMVLLVGSAFIAIYFGAPLL